MKSILHINNPNDYADYINAPKLHPLICVVHLDELEPYRRSLNRYNVYGLFMLREFPKVLPYGMETYRTSDSSIIAVAPGQVGGVEDDGGLITRNGWAVLWSPELFSGTPWKEKMEEYRFFSYFSNDSLRTDTSEWERIDDLIGKMRAELQENEDSDSLRGILRGYLHLILEYCNRIYLRQTSSHEEKSYDLLKRFRKLLSDYYSEGRQFDSGVPSVAYCASRLAYSPRYLGDVVHQSTGGTAIGYIHSFLVEKGKTLLMTGYNVSETARLLGFEYVHHFNRIFKKITGITPGEYLKGL